MTGVGTLLHGGNRLYVIVKGKEEYVRFSDVCEALGIKHPWRVLKKYSEEAQSCVKSAGEFIEDFSQVHEPIQPLDLFINTWMLSLICAAYNNNDLMCTYIDFIKEGHELKDKVEAKEQEERNNTDHICTILSVLESVIEGLYEALSDE